MEDWEIKYGRLRFSGIKNELLVNLLTHEYISFTNKHIHWQEKFEICSTLKCSDKHNEKQSLFLSVFKVGNQKQCILTNVD